MQQRFEIMCRNRQEAITLHRAHGHPNNRMLLLNLEAKGILDKHLKRYILAVSCDACRTAIGKRDNKTSTVTLSKRKAMAQQKRTDKAQRKHSAQQKSLLQSFSYSNAWTNWISALSQTQWIPHPLSLNHWHAYTNLQRQVTVLTTHP